MVYRLGHNIKDCLVDHLLLQKEKRKKGSTARTYRKRKE